MKWLYFVQLRNRWNTILIEGRLFVQYFYKSSLVLR